MISTEISVLTEPDAADFLEAIGQERSEADWRRLAGFIAEMRDGQRAIWVASDAKTVRGMITLRWRSDYPGFRAPAAPEIVDLYVWRNARQRGLGGMLLRQAESAARERGHKRIGLGVGILRSDAPAWQFYLRRGYAFDGTGAWWNGLAVQPGSVIDHAQAPVLLMMDKTL